MTLGCEPRKTYGKSQPQNLPQKGHVSRLGYGRQWEAVEARVFFSALGEMTNGEFSEQMERWKSYVYIYIYTYLEPVCSLFWWLNPSKQGLFQSKQGSFGFQVIWVPIKTRIHAATSICMFPKIVCFPPKSSILIGFSIIFTIHFWKHLYMRVYIYIIIYIYIHGNHICESEIFD